MEGIGEFAGKELFFLPLSLDCISFKNNRNLLVKEWVIRSEDKVHIYTKNMFLNFRLCQCQLSIRQYVNLSVIDYIA